MMTQRKTLTKTLMKLWIVTYSVEESSRSLVPLVQQSSEASQVSPFAA